MHLSRFCLPSRIGPITAALAVALSACGTDDESTVPPDAVADAPPGDGSAPVNDTASEAPTSDAAAPGGDVAADVGPSEPPAYMVLSRVRSPDSRTMFVSVVDELAGGEIDLGSALELSGLSRARVFGGKVFTFDGETGEVTRWALGDDGVLAEDVLPDGGRARFSMAGEGVTRFTSLIAFISETRAYYIDVFEQFQVVVWNPREMVIESTFATPELGREGLDTTGGSISVLPGPSGGVADGWVVMPVYWASFLTGAFEPVTALAVLSAGQDELVRIVEDTRCVGAGDAFVSDGAVYITGDSIGGLAEVSVPEGTLPPACLLRWTPGADALDDSFYLDLTTTLGTPLVTGALGAGDGRFVTQGYSASEPPRDYTPLELIDAPVWQRFVVDFQADPPVAARVESLAPAGVSAVGWAVDGDYLFPQFDEDAGTSKLFRMGADGATTQVRSILGEFFLVQRLR